MLPNSFRYCTLKRDLPQDCTQVPAANVFSPNIFKIIFSIGPYAVTYNDSGGHMILFKYKTMFFLCLFFTAIGGVLFSQTQCELSVGDFKADRYDAADFSITVPLELSLLIQNTQNPVTLGYGVQAVITDDCVTVTAETADPIRFTVSGSLDRTLEIAAAGTSAVELAGVAITAANGPALCVSGGGRTFIVTASGSENNLSDARSADQDGKKGSVYAAGALVLTGTGTLTVNGAYKSTIYGGDYIRVTGGTVVVNAAGKNAILAVNGFIFDDGMLRISATGTARGAETKGIKVEGSESAFGAGKGWIALNGGTLDIESVGKAVTASWDIDEDASTASTADDPDPSVTVNGGLITIKTTGTPYETAKDSLSPEGIEGKSRVTVNGGQLTLLCTDDCLNAGNDITINGGYVYAASSQNDAIDSNGTIHITGGVIVAAAPTRPECAFDCDSNTFSITGGIIAGFGSSNYSRPTESACTQNVLVFADIGAAAGTTIALSDEKGKSVYAVTIPCDFEIMIVSSPAIRTGTYELKTSVSAEGDCFNGLYAENPTVSGGVTLRTVTVSARVTAPEFAPAGRGFGDRLNGNGKKPFGMPPENQDGNMPERFDPRQRRN